jgi:bifunctional non-homologous end joining protein LigD
MPVFVIQKHFARTLHYDFRLEKNGVLKSWAVPKGLPLKPDIKRLAIETEDHDLDYAGWEGTIPKGSYGAEKVEVWDQGEYEVEEWLEDRIVFKLHGKQANGRYCMGKFEKAGEKIWLLFALR